MAGLAGSIMTTESRQIIRSTDLLALVTDTKFNTVAEYLYALEAVIGAQPGIQKLLEKKMAVMSGDFWGWVV